MLYYKYIFRRKDVIDKTRGGEYLEILSEYIMIQMIKDGYSYNFSSLSVYEKMSADLKRIPILKRFDNFI